MIPKQMSEQPYGSRVAEHEGKIQQDAWPEAAQQSLQLMMARVNSVLLGKKEVVTQVFSALLAGGHVLLEDVPGVGKTLLVRAIARVMGGEFRRIQFTSDMQPADVVGGMIWDGKRGELVFRQGPLMANVVLADEINRTPPRTQSALLEAMEERSVSADGETRLLPQPFMLLATQNPLRDDGTYPLPEAQLDRFMMRLSIGYPAAEDEIAMLEGKTAQRLHPESLRPVIIPEEWLRMQRDALSVHVHPALMAYAVHIVSATRTSQELLLGASPRATLDWVRAAQATAYIGGRRFVVPDDLKQTAEHVLAHRLLVRDEALVRGKTAAAVLGAIMSAQPIPIPSGDGGRRR
ncbi:MoxR family ATPase [Paenibacillus sp. CF384]|uniref:AAA family ATPase n=1 Tax=Paenibacillus sp. CF384 TaxID=1884382 RepID=UPI0008946921|nr:MoxR family ATPase [Paenibacillus sp. CF384]SDW69840.1 MoxR-like ATPase [Paenibacillus sp. CF384]